MAKIDRYTQGNLELPKPQDLRADTSGETIARAFTGAAEGIARTQENIDYAKYLDAQEKQKDLDAQQAKIDEANMNARIGMNVQSADGHLQDMSKTLQQKYKSDTSGFMDEFKTQTKNYLQQATQNIQDPVEKAKTMEGISGKLNEYTKSNNTWQFSQNDKIADANLKATAGAFSKTVSDGTMQADEFNKRADDYRKQNLASYQYRYGPDAQEKMDTDIARGAQNYLYDAASKQPQFLDAKMEKVRGNFAGHENEIEPFVTQVKAIAAQQQRQDREDAKMAQVTANMNATLSLINHPDNKTGRLEDAPPDAIRQAQQQLGSNATPEMAERLAGAAKKSQSTKNNVHDEGEALKYMGDYQAKLEGIAAKVEGLYNQLPTAKTDDEHNRITAELQRQVDDYQSRYESLNQLKSSMHTPEGKAFAQDTVLRSAAQRFQQVMGVLTPTKGLDPGASSVRKTNALLMGRMQGGTAPQIYSDPKQQALFSYYYKNGIHNIMETMSASNAKSLFNDKGYRDRTLDNVRKNALHQMEGFKFSR